MDKDKLCNSCGLLPQHPVQPKPPVCRRKKKCCKKDCCENEFVFRKVVIPAALGDDITGKDKPVNGAYTNSYVEYEANGAQYMYDSYGIYTKMEGGDEGGGVSDFNELENRPKYAGEEMTGDTDIPDVNTAVANEATLREAADTALSGDIAAEATTRQNADSSLQSQIDALSASSDVTDIVGTYAELQNYDTSTLGDNDIIKVLQDEEHDDETTYYRWSTTTQTFTLIGEEGPYYTKSAADAKFQDKLTAGANITIDANNEISATDTTYTAGANVQINGTTISATDTTYNDFTGTDGVNAGTAGLVPAPAVADAGKYLKADGTWGSIVIPQSGIPTDATFWGARYDGVNNKVAGLLTFVSEHGYNTTLGASGNDVYLRLAAANRSFYISGYQNNTIVSFGDSTISVHKPVYMYSQKITNMGDPTAAQDAATKNYTDNLAISYAALNGTAAPTTATVGKYVGQLYYDTTNEQLYFLKEIDETTTPATYTWEAVGGGSSVNVVQTIGTSQTDVMSQNAVTSCLYGRNNSGNPLKSAIVIGPDTYQGAYGAGVHLGNINSSYMGVNSIAIGDGAGSSDAPKLSNVRYRQIAIGGATNVSHNGSIALGFQATTGRDSELSIGKSNSTRFIANVTDPTLPQDAATKNYCDSLAVVTFPNSTFDAIIGEI